MSTHRRENNTLPPLQKEIVLHLAKNGPQTINQTVKKIKHSYHPSWIAFSSLEEKGIVKKGKMRFYRGNKYPLYWLTEDGVIASLIENASPIDLLTRTKEVYPSNERLQYALDMARHLNPKIFRIALDALKSKGKLEASDLAEIFIAQSETDTTLDEFAKTMATMRKYPKEHNHVKERISQMQENFNKIAKIINANEKE